VLTPCGDDLLSVPAASPPDAEALAAHLRKSGDWIDVVAGIDSVVVHFDSAAIDGVTAQKILAEALAHDIEPQAYSGELLEVPVVYGGELGPDLDDLCREAGISTDDFIALHTGREYPVEMVGFTPGFAFVGGLDERLRVPRRNEPRQRVAAGSIGIADGRTGMYALASPGGWTLVGRTPLKLFDAQAADPFRVHAGMRIRFRAIAAGEFES